VQWRAMCGLVDDVGLVLGPDEVLWHLEGSGYFLIKSL
jgi:hypothetical protein